MKIISLIKEQRSPFYSMEFFPPKDPDLWPDFFENVEKLKKLNPLFASVTYGAGGSTKAYTLEITKELARRGIVPMAHLTCSDATSGSIRQYLKELKAAGVQNILALRGDPPQGKEIDWNSCEFPHASDLVSFVAGEFPEFGMAVAAYLTPHPESDSFVEDRLATVTKMKAGGDFAVTQLFFDHREYFEYVGQMRALGVTKPILPGVLPVQSLDSLRRILSLSGGNIPAKLYLKLEEAHRNGGNEAVREAGIDYAASMIVKLLDSGAPGIHLYTLNKADVCLQIADKVGKF